VNTQLGRYTILERIASGGMATVFRARDINLDRDVAIKLLHNHIATEPGFKERFVQEARTLASINHPHIVQIYDFDVEERNGEPLTYMVMQYVPNTTLDSLLKEHQKRSELLPYDQVRTIIADVCSALSYAHERGLVHRDIKPGNVLIDHNQRAVLTDFGIARLARTSAITQEGTIVGTPAYMSPEQATGDKIDGRSDLYSLGVILFQLLTGRLPFEEDNTVSMLLKHVQVPPPQVSDLLETGSRVYDLVVAKALAKNPQERYQTAEEFARDVQRMLSDEDHRTQHLPRLAPPPPPTIHLTPSRPVTRPPITLLRTLDTAVLKPARQNPLTFVSLAIAVISLLVVARISQPAQAANSDAAVPQSVNEVVDSMTEDALYGFVTFEANDKLRDGWPLGEGTFVRRSIPQDGTYQISTTGEGMATSTLFDPSFVYDDVQITMDASLTEDSAPAAGYGIIFRYQDADNYNVFAVDGVGRYSLWTRENGEWRELRGEDENWSPHEAVASIGQVNKISIIVYRDLLVGYVNGRQIVRLQEDTFEKGSIGIYLASPAGGQATVNVDSYLIARSENPAFSMTDTYSSGGSGRRPTPTPTATPVS
jgi:serine/threonine-protein kinase